MDNEVRVLVVEDEAPVRRLMARALAKRGYSTTEAPDAATALRLVEHEDFAAILLDHGLPDLPGTEVLRQLRRSRATATTPVLLVTGRASVPERVEGLTAGANDYLVKPVDLEELVARVDAQVRGREAWRTEVADALSERAALASALASIDTTECIPAAVRVAELLAEIPEMSRVAVVDLTGVFPMLLADSATPLEHRDARDDGQRRIAPIPPSLAAELRQTVASRGRLVSARVRDHVLSGTRGRVTAFGVEDRREVVAALLVEANGDSFANRRAPDAAVGDLLPVIDRVLGPLVTAGRRDEAGGIDVRAVVDARAFHTVFQPIVDLATDTVVGFEALTRFADGTPPHVRFLQAAALGLGTDLERATLEVALAEARDLPVGRYVSYNVSASLLLEGELAGTLQAGAHHDVVLEITEHERIDDYEAVRSAMSRLGDVRLSVDDAGSGWSSLRHVLSLRPDFVKVDRGWVHEIDRDPARQALLLGIARFVEEMGGQVIAEGVETVGELETLRRLGIPRGQGFHLGRPATVAELDDDRS